MMNNYDNNNKGALWIKTAKTGRKYMGGEIVINGQKHFIKVFKNYKKIKEIQPDYNLIVDQPQNVAQQNTQAVNQTFNQPEQDPWNQSYQQNVNQNDDSIPF